MKVLTGFMGLMIFAISLPSASQTADVRVTFFNNFFPRPNCELTDDKKAALVQFTEMSNGVTLNWSSYNMMNPSKKTLVENHLNSKLVDTCNEISRLKLMNDAANTANNNLGQATLNSHNAALVARNTPVTTTGRPGAPGGAQADNLAVARTGVEGISAAQAAYTRDTSGRGKGGTSKDGPADGPSGQRGNANSGAATAPAGNGGTAAAGQAGSAAATTAKPNPYTYSNDGEVIVDKNSRSITLSNTEAGDVTFKYDPKTKGFIGDDGKTYSADEVISRTPSCTEDCASALKTIQADPQSAAIGADLVKGSATDAKTAADLANIETATTELQTASTAAISGAGSTECAPLAAQVKTAIETYTGQIATCAKDVSRADNMCSLVRSPKAILVQKLMSVGTMIINKSSSAAENCGFAQDFSRVAQMGLTAANFTCTAMKLMCDSSCAPTPAQVAAVATGNKALIACGEKLEALSVAAALKAKGLMSTGNVAAAAPFEARSTILHSQSVAVLNSTAQITKIVAVQQKVPPEKIKTCESHEMDIAGMALQIIGIAEANKKAKECKKALAGTGGGGGGTGTNPISMDEFCKVPGQAANPPCLCRTSPTATGCPGALTTTTTTTTASNGANGGGARTTSSGGSSAMATPGGLSGMQTGTKSTLSNEAKAALGITDDAGLTAAEAEAAAATAGGVGNGDTSAGGSDGGGGSSALAKSPGELAKKANANKKGGVGSGFDDFSLGGFGNIKFGPDGKAVINGRKYTEDEIKKMVERKIASEEFHIQVTTASGKSNWDKVRVRYDENRSSLYP